MKTKKYRVEKVLEKYSRGLLNDKSIYSYLSRIFFNGKRKTGKPKKERKMMEEDTEEIIHNLEIGEEYVFIYPKVDDIPEDKVVIKRIK